MTASDSGDQGVMKPREGAFMRIARDSRMRRVSLHFAVAYAILGVVGIAGSLWGYTGVHALIAAAALCYSLIAMLLRDAVPFFLLLLFTASIVPMVTSNVYIEFGNYISEQGRNGFANGATLRLVIYCLLFLYTAYATIRAIAIFITTREDSRLHARFVTWSYLLHAAVIACSAVVLVVYGSPLLRGEDRFAYWSQVPEVFDRLPYMFGLVCFTTAISMVIDSRRRRLIPIALFGASVAVLLLFSDKFTALFTTFILAVSGYYIARVYLKEVKVRFGRLLIVACGTAIVLLAVAALGYVIFYGYNIGNVGAKLVDRAFGLQGHMWFGVDRVTQVDGPTGNWAQLFPPYGYDGRSGMELLMYQVADAGFIDRVLDSGVRFTMAGQALPVFVLGYGWALVYQLLAGMLCGLFLAYLLFSVARLNLLSIMIASAGVRQMTNAFMMGDAGDLYKPLTAVIVLWILIDMGIWLYRRRKPTRPGMPGDKGAVAES